MKNIHLLPTDKPSRLFKDDFGKLIYSINMDQEQNHFEPQHLFITSDEEIKAGDWYYLPRTNLVYECTEDPTELNLERSLGVRKIILTTDPDLIKDGVQAIDDDFLEWFVKNPSCEEVPIIPKLFGHPYIIWIEGLSFKEEPKQETLEEAAVEFVRSHDFSLLTNPNHLANRCFQFGAKWQAERSQSIVPFDAYNIEVFAIKPDEQGKLFAYIGYKISNGNFHFSIVPFTEPKGT